ncbi:MAG: hypothetical protein IKL55_02765 [Clostridia bacterium]|nr:hypothetical protein [Clostridia bacterium]
MVLTLERREAYSELLEILRHMDKTYVDLIPKKLIMFFYDNCSLDYDFRMTKSIGEESFKEDTLALLALINNNYWAKNQSKEELIMNYAIIDKNAQKQLNSQLEKNNVFTKIDVPTDSPSSEENLPIVQNTFLGTVKKVLNILKNAFIKFFGD